MSEADLDSGLWDWSLAAYARPGVAEACLSLQDNADQNAPLLLWSAWSAATGRTPDAETIEAACDTARAWSSTTIEPLRAIRRTLKAQIHDLDSDARQAVRARVKAVELLAERYLLTALEALSPPDVGESRPVVDGLVATARVWSRVVPRASLTALADRLSD